jgi:UDP-2-acetamido-2-deoxy-ribo-hexuluronate aminotransferase
MSSETKEVRMVDTITQYEHIRGEVDSVIREVLETGMYIGGPIVNRFRENLAKYLGIPHVIPCANGTDALQIALMALDLKPGDEVITSPFTFFATAEVIALLGLRPVFADIDPLTFNIDPSKIETAITPQTKCIIPVHLFGQCADMEPIMKIAEKHGIYVIEDNAQAIGSEYLFSDGRKVKGGTIGHIGCTSFYPSKNLGAYGDAGAIFTPDPIWADRLQVICNHGSHKKYYHERIGVNSRLDAIQAGILDAKLKHLDAYNQSRQQAAAWYDELLRGVQGIQIPGRASYSTHVFHQYTLRIEAGRAERDRIQQELAARKIPSMVYYPVPLHIQEAYQPYGFVAGDFPVSEKAAEEVLSLPMHSELTKEQVEYVVDNFLACIKR